MIAWFEFFIIAAVTSVAFFIPGLVVYSRFKLPRHLLLAISPTFSLLFVSVVMLTSFLVKIPLESFVYIILLVLITLVFMFLNNGFVREVVCSTSKSDLFYLSLYLLVSFLIVTAVYVKNLDGPQSVIPFFDNAFALSAVKSFSNTKLYGVIFSSCYSDTSVLFDGYKYYPACMHSISALLVNIFNISASEALNIIIFVALFPILSLSVRSFIASCYPFDSRAQFFGAFASFAFVGFPWGLITFGSLQANLFSLAFLPVSISSSIQLANCLINKDESTSSTLYATVISLVVLGLSHPGSLFAAGVVLIPLIAKTVYHLLLCRLGKIKSITVAFVSLLIMACVWVLCFKIPALQPTVSFNWPAFQSFSMAISSILTLSFFDFPSQLIVAFLVFVGILSGFRTKESSNWLIAAFFFVSFLYIVDVSADGWFKQLLTGFWYTDSRRVAAMVVFTIIPFLSKGLSTVSFYTERFVSNLTDSVVSPFTYSFVCVSIFLGLIFGPTIYLSGSFAITSAFSYVRETLYSLNSLIGKPHVDGSFEKVMLDKDELCSGKELAHLVDGQSVILNNPLDGSSFLYGLDNLNLFYRLSSPQDPSEPNVLLREHIDEYASNSDVKFAAKKYRIGYVLQLDTGFYPSSGSTFYSVYDPNYWSGIQRVDENTPGFKLIYKMGDIRLFELTDI